MNQKPLMVPPKERKVFKMTPSLLCLVTYINKKLFHVHSFLNEKKAKRVTKNVPLLKNILIRFLYVLKVLLCSV